MTLQVEPQAAGITYRQSKAMTPVPRDVHPTLRELRGLSYSIAEPERFRLLAQPAWDRALKERLNDSIENSNSILFSQIYRSARKDVTGHFRLGTLPRSQKWREVVSLLDSDAPIDVLAEAAAKALERD